MAEEFQRPTGNNRVAVAVLPGANLNNAQVALSVNAGIEIQRPRGPGPAATPGTFANWAFNPLTLRRVRPTRNDDSTAGSADTVTIRWRPRDNSAAPGSVQTVDLTNNIRQQLTIQTDVPDGLEIGVTPGSGPAGAEDPAQDGDEPMILG